MIVHFELVAIDRPAVIFALTSLEFVGRMWVMVGESKVPFKATTGWKLSLQCSSFRAMSRTGPKDEEVKGYATLTRSYVHEGEIKCLVKFPTHAQREVELCFSLTPSFFDLRRGIEVASTFTLPAFDVMTQRARASPKFVGNLARAKLEAGPSSPVSTIPKLGISTQARLETIHIYTLADMASIDPTVLYETVKTARSRVTRPVCLEFVSYAKEVCARFPKPQQTQQPQQQTQQTIFYQHLLFDLNDSEEEIDLNE
jgi:hypothetical protein